MRVIDDSPVIEISNLGKSFPIYETPSQRFFNVLTRGRYRPRHEFWALRDINFRIASGEVVGIIGRNGSGKSTLLQVISGIMQPSAGSLKLRGKLAALLELGTGFDLEETGRRNIEFNARMLGMSAAEVADRMDAIIAFADIGSFIDQPVKSYSSGMIVRLGFAINAHIDADILIVDEALSVGDAAFQFKCLSRLDALLEKGMTLLLVSHDAQLIKSYCTRAIYLRQGSVVFDGDCETACEWYQQDTLSGISLLGPQGHKFFPCPSLDEVAPDSGKVLEVLVGDGANSLNAFNGGDRVFVNVHVKVGRAVRQPCVTVIVRDVRGYNLFAFNNRHQNCDLTRDGEGDIRVTFSFITDLQVGEYSLAVRLDDAYSPNALKMLDKQVNSAGFSVFRDAKSFDAVVNLHGRIEESTSHA